MRRIFSLYLTLLLIFSLVAMPVFASHQKNVPQEAKLEMLSISGATSYTPFVTTDLTQQFIFDKDSHKAVISFTPSSDVAKVYLDDADSQTAVKEKNGIYSFTVEEANFGDEATVTRHLILEDKGGDKQEITFTGARRLWDSPDAVTDYLCIGSQYSSGGNQLTGVYGLYPEKSLIGLGYWWSPISLGNFGGYITYYYEEAIRNDPKNPYGIDFIVYGNSNGGNGFSEPGNVLVSEDGETWYTLAGSEHYEDGTKWDYRVAYTKQEDGSTAANGAMLPYSYPSPKGYPLFDWLKSGEESITVSGVLLPLDKYGNAAYPAFGYADVRTNSSTAWGTGKISTVDSRAKNPYLPITKGKTGLAAPSDVEETYEGAGDCFDLAWAVDKDGMPVKVEAIHYIKVQTASLTTQVSSIGEKSTEVNSVVRAIANDAPVGVSAPPVKLCVGGTELPLEEGVYEYSAVVKGPFTVEVEADAASNVYINNLRAASRKYALSTEKGIIRVIVQDGEKEPLIYYIAVESDPFTEQDIEAAIDAVMMQSGSETLNTPMTRAMFITTMYRLAGEPATDPVESKEPASDTCYADAMAWAAKKGIINGMGTDFFPEEYVTREQAVTMLYRYAGALGRDTSGNGRVNNYSDVENISDWAFDALDWATGSGIVNGIDGDVLDAAGSITKAQLTSILQRFFAEMVK